MADHDPNQDRQDRNVEEPGDTNSADIVGRTGEQMPKQSHDGVSTMTQRGRAQTTDSRDPANRRRQSGTGHPDW